MIGRIRRKFEQWRQEPEPVRLRIATLLTGGAGLVIVALWLFVLLPLQLLLNQPASSDEAGPQGEVAGATSAPTPSPTGEPSPTQDVEYYHGTRPSLQE